MHFFIKNLLVLSVAYALASCTGVQTNPIQTSGERSIFSYGEFCGPGHPSLGTISTREAARSFLQRRQPRDFIDAACKGHDICYTYKGRLAAECDQALELILVSIGWNYSDEACDNIRRSVVSAMRLVPSYVNSLPFPDFQNRTNPQDPSPTELIQTIPSLVLTVPAQIISGGITLPRPHDRTYDCNPLSDRPLRYLNIAMSERELRISFSDVLNWNSFRI